MVKWTGEGLKIGRITYTAHITALVLLWIAITAFQPLVMTVMAGNFFAGPVCVLLGLGFVFSLLLHEAGHAYTAIHLGIPIKEISLFALGGMAKMTKRSESAHQEFAIAIAGPLVSMALWLVFSAPLYFGSDAVWAILLYKLGFFNLIIAIFNMVPAFPLDGGRVFRSVVWAICGKVVAATTIAVRLSEVIVAAYLIFSLYQIKAVGYNIIFTILVCAFVVIAGEAELHLLKNEQAGLVDEDE